MVCVSDHGKWPFHTPPIHTHTPDHSSNRCPPNILLCDSFGARFGLAVVLLAFMLLYLTTSLIWIQGALLQNPREMIRGQIFSEMIRIQA